MPFAAIWAYLERLPEVQAEHSHMLAEIESLPWMDKFDRSQVLQRWNRELARMDETHTAPPPALLAEKGLQVVLKK